MEPIAVVLVILIIACTPTAIWSLNLRFRRRELEHKERMAALEKGATLPPLEPESQAPWTPRLYLLRGMIWLFSGLALTMAIYSLTLTVKPGGPSMEYKLERATQLRASGATEDEIKLFLNERPAENRPPAGLALFGLIPAGVGLAYLIFYGMERKNLS